MPDGILNQYEVETAIVAAVEELEAAVNNLSDLAFKAAHSENAFKKAWATALIKATAEDGKATEKTRVAMADLAASEERLQHLLNDKLYESSKQAILAIRAKLDALRTVSANVRALT